ncbi:MAG: hypothetical protein VX498_03000 [Myxococcota bacterium]|nr:hypothetical protein [Myxococcota bacterium]
MQLTVPARFQPALLLGAMLCVGSLFHGSVALANTCGVLPFTADRGVNSGATDNITSLVSSEVDIRGGFGLVLTASRDEVKSSCGSKVDCIKDFGSKNGYDRVVAGRVSNSGSSSYRIKVQIYEVSSGTMIREVEAKVSRDPGEMVGAIPDLVIELLTGKPPVEEEEVEETLPTPRFEEANFDEEDEDLADSSVPETKARSTGKKKGRSSAARDRRGRLVSKIEDEDEDEDDPLDFDELDDLNLDDITEDSQRKRARDRKDREDREEARLQEEERLAARAEEEERRREEERQRIEEERRAEEERVRERDRRESEYRRIEEERRVEEERKRRAEEDRARRDRERRDRARADAERREREERVASRARKQEREKKRVDDEPEDYEDYDLDEEDLEVIEIESSISLGSGLIVVEVDEEDDDELKAGDIVSYDEDEDSSDSRWDSRGSNQDETETSYGYERSSSKESPSSYRSQSSSRDRSYNSTDRDYDRDYDDETADRNSASSSSTAEFGRSRDRSSGYSSRSTRSGGQATARNSTSKRPLVNIKAGAGWTAYYPETLTLGMFNYGFEASVFALPWLSIDAGANFWSVSLVEYDEQGNALRTVRTLPSFVAGVSWHGTFHKVIRPYAGIDLGALLYAQAIVNTGTSTQVRPLFAPLVAADFGCDFIIIPNFGVYVGVKLGGSYAARVQETVNSSWDPNTGLAEVWAGALVQF